MIKAIFWDNDGVLVDTERLYFQATQDIMSAAGAPLTEDDYLEYFLRQGTGAWHLLSERGVGEDDIVRLRQQRNDRYSELLRRHADPGNGIWESNEADNVGSTIVRLPYKPGPQRCPKVQPVPPAPPVPPPPPPPTPPPPTA